ncbi:MAG: class I tRNA ligase family protein, partial [Xanthomonadales bacterium]
HGLIRDGHGQKMSKSKGNVLDPLDLIEGIDLETLVSKRTASLMQPRMAPAIEKATRQEFPDGIPAFGTDALRFTFATLATTGRDIRFDLGRIEGSRNFCNKLWNAARFVLMQTEGREIAAAKSPGIIEAWILSRLNTVIREVDQHLCAYRLDLAAQSLYEFIWNEYCDWYLEFTKPLLQTGSPSERPGTRHTLLYVLETILRALHPMMPFITEEIWQKVKAPLGIEGDSIMMQPFPASGSSDPEAEDDINWLKEVIQGIRRIRSELNLPPGKPLDVKFQAGTDTDHSRQARFNEVLSHLGRIQSTEWITDDADTSECAVALVGELKVLIPLKGLVDVDEELARLSKQLAREQSDLKKSEGKLGNSRFVDNAPAAVVEHEKQRLLSHQAKVENLQIQVRQLESMRS